LKNGQQEKEKKARNPEEKKEEQRIFTLDGYNIYTVITIA